MSDDCARCWDRDVKIAALAAELEALRRVVRCVRELELPDGRTIEHDSDRDEDDREIDDTVVWLLWGPDASSHPTLSAALRAAGDEPGALAVEAALRGVT